MDIQFSQEPPQPLNPDAETLAAPSLHLQDDQPTMPIQDEQPRIQLHSDEERISLQEDEPVMPVQYDRPALPLHYDEPAEALQYEPPTMPMQYEAPAVPSPFDSPAPPQQTVTLSPFDQPSPPMQSRPIAPSPFDQPSMPAQVYPPPVPGEDTRIHLQDEPANWHGNYVHDPNARPPIQPSLFHEVQEDCTMAMLAHLLGIATVFLGPLMIFLVMKNQSKFVAFHALQALVFQCVMTAGYAVSFIMLAAKANHIVLTVVFVLSALMGIVTGLAANRGEWYEIPGIGSIAQPYRE